MVGVAPVVDEEQAAARAHPAVQRFVIRRLERFLTLVGHHENLYVAQGLRMRHVFELDDFDGQPVFYQRHGQRVEGAEMRVAGLGQCPLKHHGVGYHDADPARARVVHDLRLAHLVQSIDSDQ